MRYKGKVYFIGAGPGDPELITLKAVRILQKANYILYDNLVGKEILQYAKNPKNNIYVGKKIGIHFKTQNEINQLFLQYIQKGETIVRLKGGDPLIFGRLDEEIQFLREQKIPLEIIPGITAASSAAAELECSLTQRESGQSVIFLSGYSKEYLQLKEHLPKYDWKFLASNPITLVFYMGFYNLQKICEKLIENGKSKDTKIAVITNSSLQYTKKVVGNLKNINTLVQQYQLTFPAIVIIGDTLNRFRQTPFPAIQIQTKKQGILAIFHGAQILQQSSLPQTFINSIQQEMSLFQCTYGFLTENFHPNYKEAIEYLIELKKVDTVYIWPIFLLPGKHLNIDIPKICKILAKQYKEKANIVLLEAPDINKDLTISLKKQLLSQLREYL